MAGIVQHSDGRDQMVVTASADAVHASSVLPFPGALRQSMTNISSVLKRSDNTWGPAGVTRIMS